MTTNLSPNEQALLAREVAADQYDREWPLRTTLGNTAREGFCAGWDAAMEYAAKRAAEGIGHLDNDDEDHDSERDQTMKQSLDSRW
jgi:hypothetical protein